MKYFFKQWKSCGTVQNLFCKGFFRLTYWKSQFVLFVLVVCCFKCSLVACLCGEWINLCKDKAFLNLIMLEALKELWPHLGKYLQRPGNCDRALLILCNMSLKTLAWFTIAGPACQFIGHHGMGAPLYSAALLLECSFSLLSSISLWHCLISQAYKRRQSEKQEREK